MGLALKRFSPDVAQFGGALSVAEVDSLVADRTLKRIQTESPMDLATADLLNERLFSRREDVEFRVYWLGGPVWDLKFVTRMPNLRRLTADSMLDAKGIEYVTELPKLRELGIGIRSLESFNFLNDLASDELTSLSLDATASKKPSLAPLRRFAKLQRLYLEGQQKEIEVVAGLPHLEDVTLRSITTPDVEYLRPLKQLWSVDIKLGGTKNLAALEGMTSIKYLELWQIRGLADLAFVSTLANLQFLFLQSLPQVHALPDLSRLKKLRRVHLETMKGLKDVRGLAAAPALEELIHVDAKGMEPADYVEVLQGKSLKRIRIGTGSTAKNEEVSAMAAARGVEADLDGEFQFN
jgi:hypothetical protein